MGIKTNTKFLTIFITILVTFPILIAGTLGGIGMWRDLTNTVLSRRQEITDVASSALHERLARLSDAATHASMHEPTINLIEQGAWQKAVESLTFFQESMTELKIDRIFLTDMKGIQLAAIPRTEETIGKDFSYRDWYQGVTTKKAVYISEIYRRTAQPQYNVIAAAVPIHNKKTGKELGILVLQVKLDPFFEWSDALQFQNGDIFFVDQHGNVAGFSGTSPQENIVNMSTEDDVMSVLQGKRALYEYQTKTNGALIVSTAPVLSFGWGVVYREEATSVFASRNKQITTFVAEFIAFFVIACVAAIIIIRMLHRRQKAEANLRASEIFLDSIIEHLPNMIFVKDAENLRFVRFNRAGETLLGYNRTELIGKNDYDFFPPEEATFFIANDRAVLASGKERDIPEEPIQTRYKGTRYLHTKKIPISDGKGCPRYLLGISEDITDKKNLTNAKNQFFAITSHELNTPLSKIRWALEILTENKDHFSPAEQRLLADAYATTLNMGHLIERIITLTQIEARALHIHKRTFPLRNLFLEILQEEKGAMEEKQITIVIECEDTITILADFALIKEALLHLVRNALHYTEKGGRIIMSAKKGAEGIKISVHDTGIGIPQSDQPRVFERLFRSKNAQIIRPNGTGLGLYVCKQLVETLGGTVSFTSKENEGSTFTIMLPQEKT